MPTVFFLIDATLFKFHYAFLSFTIYDDALLCVSCPLYINKLVIAPKHVHESKCLQGSRFIPKKSMTTKAELQSFKQPKSHTHTGAHDLTKTFLYSFLKTKIASTVYKHDDFRSHNVFCSWNLQNLLFVFIENIDDGHRPMIGNRPLAKCLTGKRIEISLRDPEPC